MGNCEAGSHCVLREARQEVASHAALALFSRCKHARGAGKINEHILQVELFIAALRHPLWGANLLIAAVKGRKAVTVFLMCLWVYATLIVAVSC